MADLDPAQTRRRTLVGLVGLGVTALTGCVAGSSGGSGTATRSATGGRLTGAPPSDSATSPAASPTAPSASTNHGDVSHGLRTRYEVALTFHGAGDPSLVDRLIQETRRTGAHVTVLAVGQWAAANPGVLQRLLGQGHEVGNHTWSHRTMTQLSGGEIRSEIERAASELRRQTGGIGAWFRPSGTPRSTPQIRDAARSLGYPRCLAYDVDSLDYTDPGPPAIVRTVSAQARPGSIISLHLGHDGTMLALPEILAVLRRRGLRAVTAGELLRGSP
jgi:peptidoglycan/xylan/chitin deacetylase (PgdA/CDA1 family)